MRFFDKRTGIRLDRSVVSGVIAHRSQNVMKERKRYAKEAYDVALSFAGEDRQYAKECGRFSRIRRLQSLSTTNTSGRIFGGETCTSICHRSTRIWAHYCVVFLSQIYAKIHCGRDTNSAVLRQEAFEENREYILPVRLDDTEIPGLLPTVMYLDLSEMSIKEVYQELKQKLSGTGPCRNQQIS